MSINSLFRSASPEHRSSRLLKSSSLIPTQFRASARTPVTLAVLAVSLVASISPSMGRESPKVPLTPAAIRVQRVTSCSLRVSLASSWDASVAVSVSPRIL